MQGQNLDCGDTGLSPLRTTLRRHMSVLPDAILYIAGGWQQRLSAASETEGQKETSQ